MPNLSSVYSIPSAVQAQVTTPKIFENSLWTLDIPKNLSGQTDDDLIDFLRRGNFNTLNLVAGEIQLDLSIACGISTADLVSVKNNVKAALPNCRVLAWIYNTTYAIDITTAPYRTTVRNNIEARMIELGCDGISLDIENTTEGALSANMITLYNYCSDRIVRYDQNYFAVDIGYDYTQTAFLNLAGVSMSRAFFYNGGDYFTTLAAQIDTVLSNSLLFNKTPIQIGMLAPTVADFNLMDTKLASWKNNFRGFAYFAYHGADSTQKDNWIAWRTKDL